MTINKTLTTLALAAALAFVTSAEAQDISRQINSLRSGSARMEYEARPGVCGNGENSVSFRGTRSSRHADEWEGKCTEGPVRVVIDKRNGEITDIRTYVGGSWKGSADVELGAVPPSVAINYLLKVAETNDSKSAERAIFPAMLGAGVESWPRLMDIARDESRPRAVRNSAVFWVAQRAGDAATRDLIDLVETDEGDRRVRESAVFAISQQKSDDAVPALIRIAKTNRDPKIRKSAIFWLGQSKDDRALKYFEDVLLGARE